MGLRNGAQGWVSAVCGNVSPCWAARSVSPQNQEKEPLLKQRCLSRPRSPVQTEKARESMPESDPLARASPIHVVLADDHDILRQGLKMLLGLQPEIDVVRD